jgi:hypothetical protein
MSAPNTSTQKILSDLSLGFFRIIDNSNGATYYVLQYRITNLHGYNLTVTTVLVPSNSGYSFAITGVVIDHIGHEIRYGDQFVSTDNMSLSSLYSRLAHAMFKMGSYYVHESNNEQLVQLGHEYALAAHQLEKLAHLVHHELKSYDRIVSESITLAGIVGNASLCGCGLQCCNVCGVISTL